MNPEISEEIIIEKKNKLGKKHLEKYSEIEIVERSALKVAIQTPKSRTRSARLGTNKKEDKLHVPRR
jgi:hypothetical protein